jgi:hypothetical protein
MFFLLLTLSVLQSSAACAAPATETDFTYEEWLERKGCYLSPSGQQCRDGYLDLMTGVFGKLIVVAAKPISQWTVGKLFPHAIPIWFGAQGIAWLGNEISNEGLWLCWCLPHHFQVRYDFMDEENKFVEFSVIELFDTNCCERTAVGIDNYQQNKCANPNPDINECLRAAWFGQNLCF